jgi:hypothetical protein
MMALDAKYFSPQLVATLVRDCPIHIERRASNTERIFLAEKATNEVGDKQGDGFGVFVSSPITEYEYGEWCPGIL